jgi:hypothetical protein
MTSVGFSQFDPPTAPPTIIQCSPTGRLTRVGLAKRTADVAEAGTHALADIGRLACIGASLGHHPGVIDLRPRVCLCRTKTTIWQRIKLPRPTPGRPGARWRVRR